MSPPTAPSQPEPERKARRKKRRGGLGGKPIRQPPKPKRAAYQPPRERLPDQPIAEVDTRDMQTRVCMPSINDMLPELWSDNYDASLKREMQENDAIGLTQAAYRSLPSIAHHRPPPIAPPSTIRLRYVACTAQAAWLMQNVAPRSTYQLNSRQSAELATAREARDQRMRRKWAASARHANNQRDTPFSMLARSIGMLGRRVSRKSWSEDKSLLSKARAEYYLFLLTPLRPPPAFRVATQVSVYVWDQFYLKAHCAGKNGEYRGRKSITSSGLAHEWHKITNINTLEVSCRSPRPILCHASHALRAPLCGRLYFQRLLSRRPKRS